MLRGQDKGRYKSDGNALAFSIVFPSTSHRIPAVKFTRCTFFASMVQERMPRSVLILV